MLIKTWFGILDLKIVIDILACFPFEVFGLPFQNWAFFAQNFWSVVTGPTFVWLGVIFSSLLRAIILKNWALYETV